MDLFLSYPKIAMFFFLQGVRDNRNLDWVLNEVCKRLQVLVHRTMKDGRATNRYPVHRALINNFQYQEPSGNL
jgi:hypothetical protein